VQFHLGEQLIERLAVHAALVHRSQGSVVEEVLLGWLLRFGKGRDLWGEELPDEPKLAGDVDLTDGKESATAA
jgi:hypothetical protein